jgi:hypothetical protein
MISEQHKDEIMKLKLEIEALRRQNTHLQQKLLISLSDHHSSMPMVEPPQSNHEATAFPSSLPPLQPPPSPAAQAYPPEGFLEEGDTPPHLSVSQECPVGMAALLNSTPTKILRGIYQNTVQRTPSSIENALDGMTNIVTQSLSGTAMASSSSSYDLQQEQEQPDLDDFEAWYLALSVPPSDDLPSGTWNNLERL